VQAIRETHDVLDGAVTIHLPAGFAARRVEVIVLPVAEEAADIRRPPRRPAPGLGVTIVRDDLIAPAASPDDWDALK
jgi:hypothetical protein